MVGRGEKLFKVENRAVAKIDAAGKEGKVFGFAIGVQGVARDNRGGLNPRFKLGEILIDIQS